jgi:hypothetical protein
MDLAKMKLGRLRRPEGKAVVQLAAHQSQPLPPAPPTWDGSPGCTFPMFGNDVHEDCTIAALAHQLHMQAVREGRQEQFTDREVLDYYLAMTGGKDGGLVEVDVLERARQFGFPYSGQHRLGAWAALAAKDHEHVKSAAVLFNGVYVGAELPLEAQQQAVWDVTGPLSGPAAAGSWGGHAMVVAGYDARGVTFVTWGGFKRATWTWWDAYVDEAYAWLDFDRAQVAGVRWNELLGELTAVASHAPMMSKESGSAGCPVCGHWMHEWNYEDPDALTGAPTAQKAPHVVYLGELKKDAQGVYSVPMTEADWTAVRQALDAGEWPPVAWRSVERCAFCSFQTDTETKNFLYRDPPDPSGP